MIFIFILHYREWHRHFIMKGEQMPRENLKEACQKAGREVT